MDIDILFKYLENISISRWVIFVKWPKFRPFWLSKAYQTLRIWTHVNNHFKVLSNLLLFDSRNT